MKAQVIMDVYEYTHLEWGQQPRMTMFTLLAGR